MKSLRGGLTVWLWVADSRRWLRRMGVAALAVVNVVLVGLGLAIALRLGVRLHE